jgi:hypothetical protein
MSARKLVKRTMGDWVEERVAMWAEGAPSQAQRWAQDLGTGQGLRGKWMLTRWPRVRRAVCDHSH